MYKSQITIIATCKNADENTVKEIAEAIQLIAEERVIISDNGVIEAVVPTHSIAEIGLMEGVCYVRPSMTYAC
jgi:hypothetical protein